MCVSGGQEGQVRLLDVCMVDANAGGESPT